MKFDDKIGSIQQILTATNVGILRRQAIIKELNLKKEQTVIDIGCGGGHLVEEISMCIGSSGRAIGVDPSEFQIKTAKERCKHLPNVQFLCSNASDINIDKSSNLKFKAFKKGSRPSPIKEIFYKKTAARITDFKLLTSVVPPYERKDILTDNAVGSFDFRDGSWNGFLKSDSRSGDMIAEFSIPDGVKEIGISCLSDITSHILFPTKIELYKISTGNDELVYSKNVYSKTFDEEKEVANKAPVEEGVCLTIFYNSIRGRI